jgi:hypothetical protein
MQIVPHLPPEAQPGRARRAGGFPAGAPVARLLQASSNTLAAMNIQWHEAMEPRIAGLASGNLPVPKGSALEPAAVHHARYADFPPFRGPSPP